MSRTLRLALHPYGVGGPGQHGLWKDPTVAKDASVDIDYYIRLAKTAEAALFDALFIVDSQFINATYPAHYLNRLEPLTLLSAVATHTTHLGLVGTLSSTYNSPFNLARRFASLDHISRGRAGWNVVTSFDTGTSRNYGLDEHLDYPTRYGRALESVQVVRGLWDSYEDDAFLRDRESGLFVDPDKVHLVDHRGAHFQIRGPLNVGRPPQGYPVVVQAGASDAGRELAGRTAEVVFTANLTLEDAQAFYADLKARAGRYGRQPHEILIMPGIFPVLGGSEAEAQANYEALQALIHPSVAWSILKRHYGEVDLSGYSLDDKAPPLPRETNGNRSRLKLVSDLVERDRPTLRELYRTVSTARGHRTVIGTPDQVADAIQDWFENGAADGFNIMPPVLPAGLTDFIDQVVPILRRRGLFRSEYEGRTLRDNLGLARPANRFAGARGGRVAAE